MDGYVNLVGQVKKALATLKIVSPNPASQYFLREYTEHLTGPLLVDPAQRTSRARPTVGQDSVDIRVEALKQRTLVHQAVAEELLCSTKFYWFDHEYWQRNANNILRLENMGHLLNMISDNLQLRLNDPIKPSHKRCSKCNKLFLLDARPHGGCNDATWIAIPSLAGNFKRVSTFVPSALADLVDNPEQVNRDTLTVLQTAVMSTPPGSFSTLDSWIKDLACRNPGDVSPGVLEVLLVGVSVPCSEAICETYGSMMEDYHSARFVNPGPTNDDTRLQKEMFIRLNGPPLGNSTKFCSTIASRLNIAPTINYQVMGSYNRRVTKSKVVKRLQETRSGFLK